MKTLATMSLTILWTGLLLSQKAGDITGVWYTEEKKSKVKIYREDGTYHGKLIWIRDSLDDQGQPVTDRDNPDPTKRDRPLKGLRLLRDLEWDPGDEQWEEGEVYDPESGNTYSLKAWLQDRDHLKLKGYIGISMLGRTTEWRRAE